MARAPRRRRRHYAKAPPMATAGGLVIAGIGSIFGYQATDMGDRFIAGYSTTATPAPTLPKGVTSILQYNQNAVAAKPGIARVGWGLGMMLLGFGGGALAPWAGMKMFLYGWGLGATAHLGGSLITSYVMVPLFSSNGTPTATGARLYQHEAEAEKLLNPPTTTSTTAGLGAPPQHASTGAPGLFTARGTPLAALGSARTLPRQQPVARVPVTLAARAAANGGGRLGQVTTDPSYTYENAASSPPAQSPPAYSPPAVTPPANQVPNCAPCAPQPGPNQMQQACSGGANCGCGNCGAPPEEEKSVYAHPIFRTFSQATQRSSTRLRAA